MSRPCLRASSAVAAVRYQPAVPVRRPGAFSKQTPMPRIPARASPAIVAASPYPADEPMTSATGPSPPGCLAGTACHMSATVLRQPAGWESRKRKPRFRGR